MPHLPRRFGLAAGLVVSFVGRASWSSEIDPAAVIEAEELSIEGLESTQPETIHELLPRRLPARLTGAELIELRRRVKNLGVFDLVDVEANGHVVKVRVRRKTTIAPIVELSTGETLSDSKLTLGAIEHDIDGHATRLGGKASY